MGISGFLNAAKRKGKFLVVEGTDGAGKATQARLLVRRLQNEGITVQYLDFPQYEEFYGQIIGQFLHGDFGDPRLIHPKLISPIYGLDRKTRANQIKTGIENGIWFVSSRYALSNLAHQTARLPKEQRESFILWLEELV